MSLETILLVHDDACIRSVVRAVLQQFGYEVLEAGSDEEAIHLATASRFAIDLLLTDIGTESAGHLKDLQPGMKVLCISGSARESAEYQGEQEYTVISKPLKPHLLARKIREVLDKPESLGSAELNCPLQYRFRDLDPSHPYSCCSTALRARPPDISELVFSPVPAEWPAGSSFQFTMRKAN